MNERFKLLNFTNLKGKYFICNLNNITQQEYKHYYKYLSTNEKKRASEYVNFKLSSEFALSRFFLRKTLSSELGTNAEAIDFLYTSNGKPFIRDFPIHFNLSHSNNIALLGISSSNIGVDIEYINPDVEIEELMKIFAYTKEIEWVISNNSLERFYNLWTVKESILKYQGIGITVPKFPELEVNNIDYAHQKYSTNSILIEIQKKLLFNNHIIEHGLINQDYAFSICQNQISSIKIS